MVFRRNDLPLYTATILSCVVMTSLLMTSRSISCAIDTVESPKTYLVGSAPVSLPLSGAVPRRGEVAETRSSDQLSVVAASNTIPHEETEIDRIILRILLHSPSKPVAGQERRHDHVVSIYPEGGTPPPETSGSSVPAAPEGQPEGNRTYTVRRGDNLTRIAKANGVSVADLVRWNSIKNASRIYPGQRLVLAVKASPSSVPSPASGGDDRLPFLWPTVSRRITSDYGLREDPFRPGRIEFHAAIDIGGTVNDPVYACGAGEVAFVGRRPGYGNMVILKHAGGFLTVYAHNSVNLVRHGQKVQRGQVIARVGSTGRSTAPHLHFEVRQYAKPLNPLSFFDRKPSDDIALQAPPESPTP